VLLPYNRNGVSLYYTQTIKVAVFNGIGTSKERRGPLSVLNTGGSDGRASASVSCDRSGRTMFCRLAIVRQHLPGFLEMEDSVNALLVPSYPLKEFWDGNFPKGSFSSTISRVATPLNGEQQ
jgi:hypothetical protein